MKDAAKEQEQALSELQKALKDLEDLAAKAKQEQDPRKDAVLKKLSEEQKALRDQVLRLQQKLDKMSDQTGSKNAEKASQSSQSASRNQSQASSQMSQGSQGGASASQEEAEGDLQDALDNLDKLQKQMQQQAQQDELFQIEQELKKMLTAQKDVLIRTQEVEKERPSPDARLNRKAKLKLKVVQEDQAKLAGSTQAVVKKLAEAIVFQWVLRSATDDMRESSVRLDKEETGVATQEIQEEVIQKLNELIEALRKERLKKQQGGGGGGGGGGGKPPLVPPLAEVKMLHLMQKDVNVRTKKVDQEVVQSEDKKLNKDQQYRLRRLSQKEGEIARITETLLKAMSQQPGNGAAPRGGPGGDDGDGGDDGEDGN